MADYVFGSEGDDVLTPGAGDQTVSAGSGRDTVVFSGARSDYVFSSSYTPASGAMVSMSDLRPGSPDGSDALYNVEVLRFTDGDVDLASPARPSANERPGFLGFSETSVSERAAVGATIGRVSAFDLDGDPVTYVLTNDADGALRLDGDRVVLVRPLDFETDALLNFAFKAIDDRGAWSELALSVWIDDAAETATNTAPTAIASSTASFAENLAVGTVIGRLSATDADGDALSFTLKNAGPSTAVRVDGDLLRIAKPVDYEATQSLTFTIVVTDARGAVSEQTMTLRVTDLVEAVKGGARAEAISGGLGSDRLFGFAGNDRLSGGAGKDLLNGGLGADKLFGGKDADTFVFTSVRDSFGSGPTRDSIFDFSAREKDRIDLSAIDANTKATGNQAFSFIGTAAFHGKAGELRYEKLASDTIVYGDTNGDRKADFAIHLDDPLALQKGFFIL